MVFISFMTFIAVVSIPFIDIAQALPAQSEPSPSPYIFVKPGTLLGKPYIYRTEPSFGVEERSQPDYRSALGYVVRDGPFSRAARFEHYQRKRRNVSEDGAGRGENLLSNVYPEPALAQTQTASTRDSASPTHNTSITLVPRPTSTANGVKAVSKKHKHAESGTKKSKSTHVKKD